MYRARHGCVVAAAAGLLLLTGCGGADDPAGPAPGSTGVPTSPAAPEQVDNADAAAPDPCSLVTEQEITDLVGAEVTDTTGPVDEFMGRQCEWFFPGGDLGEGQITVSVWVGHEFYSPEAEGSEGTGFEEVSGLGDLAHRWPPGQGICTVIFRTGEYVVQVLSMETGDDVCIDLARVADTRI